MEARPNACENCGSSLAEGDKYCPMCKTPVEGMKGRLASLKYIARTRPGSLLLLGILIGSIIMASAIFVPQYTEDWNKKGEYAKDKNQFEDAVEYYNKALKLNPSSEEALKGLGDAYFNLIKDKGNNYNLPLYYYKEANKCNKTGNSTYALNKIGEISLLTGEFDDAKKFFQCIIDQDKISTLDLASAWYNKGIALRKLNDSKGAIQCFNNSIAISTDEINSRVVHQNALVAMGEVLSNQNNSEEAAQYYIEALDISTHCENCKTACHNLIKILHNAGRDEEAKKYEEKCFSSLT